MMMMMMMMILELGTETFAGDLQQLHYGVHAGRAFLKGLLEWMAWMSGTWTLCPRKTIGK